jgi:hypothetical protein
MEETSTIDPVAMLATLAVLGVFVKGIVDAIRRQYPRIDGLKSQALSVAVGALIAWGFDLQGAAAILEATGAAAARVPIVPVDYLITGAALGLGAGFLAEISGRSGGGEVIIEIDEEGQPVQ